VLSLDELFACGLTRREVEVRAAQGHLHRVHRGVYAVGHPGLTREGRWLAAVKACGPGAVLSHYAAGMHYGFLDLEDRRPDVTVAQRRAPQGVWVHRTRGLDPFDVRRQKGIPITTPERTLLDLAATLSDRGLRRAMSRAQSLRLTSPRQLASILDRTPARRGASATRASSPAVPRRRAASSRTGCTTSSKQAASRERTSTCR
jgi:predicted transcriptional regulator of viral defense system